MTVLITLLRGINVSGKNKIKMEELRSLYESLGFEEIHTYIQSGNVIFRTNLLDTTQMITQIRNKINQEYGFDVIVIVRTPEEFDQIIKNNPYSDKDLTKVHVAFLSNEQYSYSIDELEKSITGQEEFEIRDKEIYLYLPHGSGRTKLTNNFFEKKLGMKATTRNLRTINKILEISSSI